MHLRCSENWGRDKMVIICADDIFRFIRRLEMVAICLCKFVHKDTFNNMLVLVQRLTWYRNLLSHFCVHDDVIKWKYFPRCWPFVRGINRCPLNPPDKDQWCGALMFSLISTWTNGRANNYGVNDLRCHRAYYDVTVMSLGLFEWVVVTCPLIGTTLHISLPLLLCIMLYRICLTVSQ